MNIKIKKKIAALYVNGLENAEVTSTHSLSLARVLQCNAFSRTSDSAEKKIF